MPFVNQGKKFWDVCEQGDIKAAKKLLKKTFWRKSINVDLLEQKAQITVVNDEKVYNLLKLVMHKAKTNNLNELVEKKKVDTALLEVKD